MGAKNIGIAVFGTASAVGGCLTGAVADAEQLNQNYMDLSSQTEQVMVVEQQPTVFESNGVKYNLDLDNMTLSPIEVESEMAETSLEPMPENNCTEEHNSNALSSLNDLFNGGEQNPEGGLVSGFSELADKIEEKQKNESKIPQQNEYSLEGPPLDNENDLGDIDLSPETEIESPSEDLDLSVSEDVSVDLGESLSDTVSESMDSTM